MGGGRRFAIVVLAFGLSCGSGTPAPGSTTLSPDLIMLACALDVSCPTRPLIASAGVCAYRLERGPYNTNDGVATLTRLGMCAASTPDCTGAFDCVSGGHGPAYCGAHSDLSCDGNTVISCDTTTGVVGWGVYPPPDDCTKYGMTCSGGLCLDGAVCQGSLVLGCFGKDLVACTFDTHLESRIDCSAVNPGGTCEATTQSCIPANACSDTEFPSCAGDTLKYCGVDRSHHAVDCAAIASHCGPDATGIDDCIPTATDCTPQSPDRCNGAALEFCVDGHYQDFDCTRIGLSTCQATATGARCG